LKGLYDYDRLTQIVFVNITKGFILRPAFPVSKLCAL